MQLLTRAGDDAERILDNKQNKLLSRLQRSKHMKPTTLTHKQREWAYTKWCEGYTRLQIAMALNVCEKTIQRALSGRVRIRPVLVYTEGADE